MISYESLRIRTPPPDNEDASERIIKRADSKARNIPTIVLGVVMINLLTFIYTNNEINMYAAIFTGFIWIAILLSIVYDREAIKRIHYTIPDIDSGV
jgi:hypothetical protein